MTPPVRSDRRRHGSLSAEEILDGARTIVEAEGLDALTMARLAKQVGAGVTSIYWYFAGRDELVEALTNKVSREMYRAMPPIGNGTWDEELFEAFVAFRDLAEATPLYREIFTYRVRFVMDRAEMAPTVLRRLEEGLAFLVEAGMTATQAVRAMKTCSDYARGYVVLQHRFDLDEPTNDDAVASIDSTTHPHLAKLDAFVRAEWLDDQQFRFGLRQLIRGIGADVGLPTS